MKIKYHLRQNKKVLIIVKIDIASIKIAVTIPKNPAAPRPALKFLPTITNPFASAKSAIDHIPNHREVIADKT